MVGMVAAGEALEILESAAILVLVLIQEVEFGLLKRKINRVYIAY
jgi:hypothetical protein